MTREEAKEKLYMEWQGSLEDNIDYAGVSDAYKMAIEALEQQPCEDCISREAVLDLCDSKDPEYKVRYFKEDVECLPPVTPRPKTGRWTRVTDKAGHLVWECDCGWQQRFYTNFCPDCGIKMQEKKRT